MLSLTDGIWTKLTVNMTPIAFEKQQLVGNKSTVADPQLIDRNFELIRQSQFYTALQLRYFVDCTAGAKTFNLANGRNIDKDILLVKTDTTTNTVTINAFTGQTIDGAASYVLSKQNDYVLLAWDYTVTNWKIVASWNVLGGVVGTTTNDNAAAGYVGEWMFAELVRASSASLSTGVSVDLTSIAITAGDWMVGGQVGFTPANTTTVSSLIGWYSTTSATIPSLDSGTRAQNGITYTSAGGAHMLQLPIFRLSLAASATLYLSANATFAVSTNVAFGNLWARRTR